MEEKEIFRLLDLSIPSAVNVSPGKTGEMVWRFNRTGNFDFACLVAGHYEAGMKGTIKVSAK